MAREVELVEISRSCQSLINKVADKAIDKFYEEQKRRAAEAVKREQERRDRISICTSSAARRNRQELYLDEAKLSRARVATYRHLAKHMDWLEGPSRVDLTSLKDIIAMQHFIDVDFEDLTLPESERRSEDVFCGASGNVCEQMFLDATRSVFCIDGHDLDFHAILEGQHASLETDPFKVEELQKSFLDRLIGEVHRCLGELQTPRLLRAVSMTMSQSGLANVERACDVPQVVVCGGDHDLRFTLQQISSKSWDLQLSVKKSGFEQCIIYGPEPQEADPMPVSCGVASSILKSARIRIVLVDEVSDVVEADVFELRKEFNLVDRRGRPLPGFSSRAWRSQCNADREAEFACVGFERTRWV